MSIGQAPAPIVQSSSTKTEPVQPTPQQQMALMSLKARVKSGANWFYWIAALSLVNTIAAVSGTNWRFLLGLSVTQVADAIAHEVGGAGTIAALVVDGIALGFFVLMGKFAGDGAKWAFIVGMAAFAIDGVGSVLFKDFIGAAFHAYALFCVYRGYAAIKPLEQVSAAA